MDINQIKNSPILPKHELRQAQPGRVGLLQHWAQLSGLSLIRTSFKSFLNTEHH